MQELWYCICAHAFTHSVSCAGLACVSCVMDVSWELVTSYRKWPGGQHTLRWQTPRKHIWKRLPICGPIFEDLGWAAKSFGWDGWAWVVLDCEERMGWTRIEGWMEECWSRDQTNSPGWTNHTGLELASVSMTHGVCFLPVTHSKKQRDQIRSSSVDFQKSYSDSLLPSFLYSLLC